MKRKVPERIIGAVTKTGKIQISKAKLATFVKQVKAKNPKAKVKFVARNAPFMRRPPA